MHGLRILAQMSLYAFFRLVPFVLGKTLAKLADKLMKNYNRIGSWISLHVYPTPMVAAQQSMRNLTMLKF